MVLKGEKEKKTGLAYQEGKTYAKKSTI